MDKWLTWWVVGWVIFGLVFIFLGIFNFPDQHYFVSYTLMIDGSWVKYSNAVITRHHKVRGEEDIQEMEKAIWLDADPAKDKYTGALILSVTKLD